MKIRELAAGLQFPGGPVAMDDGPVLLVEIARGTLSRVSPDGSLTSHVPLPDRFTTKLCFGGKDRRTAFVTLSGSGRLIVIDDWPVPVPGLKLNHEA
jgi:gluconolactonase